ncbi:MAG: T9SS type A sorting domain-containing protein, partial [Flavobacteriales bacterium]|nr:T9SS type A sorting domain-containing protein [Flavobacteriales bacterium]
MWVGTCVPACAATTITASLTGGLVSGTQTIPCTWDDVGDDNIDDGWNMIGNPFPSDFSWDASALNKTGGVTDIIYVYEPASDDYVTLDFGLCCDRDIVPSMQGFFAKTTGSAGNIVIAEADKALDANNFLKTGTDPPKLLLSLTGNGYTDEVSLYFVAGTTANYDAQYDALNPYSFKWDFANFSIMSPDSVELEYNKVPGFDQDYSFPLRINWTWPSTDTTFTISADDFSMVPTSICLTLEDTVLGIFTDLRTSTYTFTMTPDTNVVPRFMLHIGSQIVKTRVIPTCKGANDGMAIAAGQATGPWNYLWLDSNGDTAQFTSNVNGVDTLSNIPAGTYTINITNSGGLCAIATDTVMISEPGTNVLSTTQLINATCFGDSDGSIDLSVSGGIPPYSYLWSNTNTSQDVSNLMAGSYIVTITDSNNCVQTATETITEPADLLSFGNTTDITCNGDADGAIVLTVTGGTSPYNYTWSSGPTTKDLDSLLAGSYTVSILDDQGCSVSGSFTLTEPAVISAIFNAAADTVYLFQGGDLQFTNNSTGATSFEWDFNDGSPLSTVMSPMHVFSTVGTYNVSMVASNTNNCSDTAYKSTAVLDSFLVGINNKPIKLALDVKYIPSKAGLYVEFAFEEPTDVNIRVYNLLGQEVSTIDNVSVLKDKVKVLDPAKVIGTYFIKLETESGSTIGKVIY